MMTPQPLLRLLFALSIPVVAARTTEGQCPGGTPLSGTVANTTLTLASSPYCVIADVSLVNVTIQPGVVIQTDGDYSISMRAGVAANGTPTDPILFTSSTLDWNGIKFNNSAFNCAMDWCIVESADQPGIEIVDCTPQLTNCTIRNNDTVVAGAGIRIDVATGHVTLKSCTVQNNTSTVEGGGVFIDMANGFVCILEGCVIEGNVVNDNYAAHNTSFRGGGVSFVPTDGTLIASGCTFRGNRVMAYAVANHSPYCSSPSVYADGAALFAVGGNAIVTGCDFRENWSQGARGGNCSTYGNGRGAGIYFTGADNSLDVRNTAFLGNSSAVASGTAATGSGLYLESGLASVVNCTFARNGALSGLDERALQNNGADADVRNSIFYWNNPSGLCGGVVTYGGQIGGLGTTTVSYCDIQGGFTGSFNLNEDPIFLDSGSPNCSSAVAPSVGTLNAGLIFPGSPCVDKGSSLSSENDVCFPPSQGQARNDMGFTGGQQACDLSSVATVGSRTCGINENTFTSSSVRIGQNWDANVICPSTGHTLLNIVVSVAPRSLQLPNGTCLLVDTSRRVATLPGLVCPANPGQPVPVLTSLLGCAVYAQVGHYGGGVPGYMLSNSLDYVIGTF